MSTELIEIVRSSAPHDVQVEETTDRLPDAPAEADELPQALPHRCPWNRRRNCRSSRPWRKPSRWAVLPPLISLAPFKKRLAHRVISNRHRSKLRRFRHLGWFDVIGQAETGSGKTARICAPLLSRLDLNLRAPQVLVLAPTRETGHSGIGVVPSLLPRNE